MSFPLRRYPLDPTGRSPNNFVQGEEHTLGVKEGPYHPLAPYYGPFFDDRETLKVFRNGVLQEFEENYFVINLVLDPSKTFSKDVCELIVVKDAEENDVITLEYQALGGLYQNHAQGLVDLYNAWIRDNRPIDWYRIRHKPNEYPPAYHLHMLKDVIGWEPMIVAIERLINALTLRNVPAFEALIDWVLARTMEVATEEEIRNAIQADKIVSLRRLLFATKTLHFNSMEAKAQVETMRRGDEFTIDVKSTNFPDSQRLYWTIQHIDTADEMFVQTSGTFLQEYQSGSFRIPTRLLNNIDGARDFRVQIRRESVNGPVLTATRPLSLIFTYEWEFDYGALENGVWTIPSTIHSSLVFQGPETNFLIPDDYFHEVSRV